MCRLFSQCRQLLCMKQQSWRLLVSCTNFVNHFVRNKKKKKNYSKNKKKGERLINNKGTILYN